MWKLFKLFAVALIAGLVAPLAAAQANDRDSLRWRDCHPEAGPGFECAAKQVPLDHDRPHGRQISLALARLPASNPRRKVGSIFLNPGGPGGPGVQFLLEVGRLLFSDDVRARFDIVGFDPRGIVRSSPLICFPSFDESLSVLPPFAFPVSPEGEALVEELDMQLNSACQARGGPIIDHMATANVARDLDLLREAVGDRRLNYVGYSYGSFLGVTYANLFPRRVRALVVDGVLDPIAWTTGRGNEAETQPFSTRLRSDASAQETLDQFFRLCDQAGAGVCAFAGDAAGRFAALAERLRAAPIDITDPETGETFPFTYADLIGESLGAMFNSTGWADFAGFLAELEAAASPVALGEALKAFSANEQISANAAETPPIPYENFVEGAVGVQCSDSINPDDHSDWSSAGIEAERRFGYFGRIWTWVSSACAVWDGFDRDRYLGPFNRRTANPVLVVGNRFDPATRYEGAELVHRLLPRSSLLTVEAWGHTSLLLSQCVDQVVSRYLLRGRTPREGATCAQDVAPFQAVRALRAADQPGVRERARAQAVSQMALRERR